ncbi:AraC family transcriptional regulator [Pseudomonas sp. G11-1]|nr:AraC family transcriptional regulator [Pseudomonas sp. G11-1]MCO5789450.1 AraC family transcriptional regulator [Pseudomonas sp. G11-2]
MNQNANVHYPSNSTPPQHPEWLKQSRQMLALLTETERAIHRDPDAAAAYLDRAIALLGAETDSDPSQHKSRGGLARWQVARIDEFIKQHLDQSIRTSELAALLGLSVSHFSHAFKQTTGMTPLTYVAARRVEAAGQYMLCSVHSLSDVALVHGFCDQSHFCRVFRRETGLSPQTWRKLHSGNSAL